MSQPSSHDVEALQTFMRALQGGTPADVRAASTSFTDGASTLKTLVDGAVFRQYPGEFTVWSESEGAAGGYALAYIGAKRPSPDDVDEILDGGTVGDGEGDGEGFMREFSKFVKGFQAM